MIVSNGYELRNVRSRIVGKRGLKVGWCKDGIAVAVSVLYSAVANMNSDEYWDVDSFDYQATSRWQ